MQSIVRLSDKETYSDATDCVAIISDEPWESEDDIELLRQGIKVQELSGMVIDLAELCERVQGDKELQALLTKFSILTISE